MHTPNCCASAASATEDNWGEDVDANVDPDLGHSVVSFICFSLNAHLTF